MVEVKDSNIVSDLPHQMEHICHRESTTIATQGTHKITTNVPLPKKLGEVHRDSGHFLGEKSGLSIERSILIEKRWIAVDYRGSKFR